MCEKMSIEERLERIEALLLRAFREPLKAQFDKMEELQIKAINIFQKWYRDLVEKKGCPDSKAFFWFFRMFTIDSVNHIHWMESGIRFSWKEELFYCDHGLLLPENFAPRIIRRIWREKVVHNKRGKYAKILKEWAGEKI